MWNIMTRAIGYLPSTNKHMVNKQFSININDLIISNKYFSTFNLTHFL